MRRCTKCRKRQPDANFAWHMTGVLRMARCRRCKSIAARRYYKRNRAKFIANAKRFAASNPGYYRARRYGLTADALARLLRKQKGRCANRACPNPAEHVDHDHETGRVRGLLCAHCNRSLGMLKEDPVRIRGLAVYITKQGRK